MSEPKRMGAKPVDVFGVALDTGLLSDLPPVPLSFISPAAVAFGRKHIESMDDVDHVSAQQTESLMDQQRAGELAIAAMDRIGFLAEAHKASPEAAGRQKGIGKLRISQNRLAAALNISTSTLQRAREIHKNPEVVKDYLETTRKEVTKAQAENRTVPVATREGAYRAVQIAKGRHPRSTSNLNAMRQRAASLDASVRNCVRSLEDALGYLPVLTSKWPEVTDASRTRITKQLEALIGYYKRLSSNAA